MSGAPVAHEHACPSCGERFEISAEAVLPDETDLTLSLQNQPGQLVMAKTVAGVIENFAAMQVAVGASLDCATSVFISGLKYEDDTIFVTFRIANEVKGRTSTQADLFASADTHPEGGDSEAAPFMGSAVGASRDAQPPVGDPS